MQIVDTVLVVRYTCGVHIIHTYMYPAVHVDLEISQEYTYTCVHTCSVDVRYMNVCHVHVTRR